MLRQFVVVLPPLHLVHEILEQLRFWHRELREGVVELGCVSLATLVPPLPVGALRVLDCSIPWLASDVLLGLLFVGKLWPLLDSRLSIRRLLF